MDTKKFAPWNTLPNQTVLSKPVLSFLTDKLGFQGAAPVQYSVVPLMLKGKDVVVEAITGSGKTLSFLIPAAEALLSKRCLPACRESRHNVIVCCLFPTRELATQVHLIAQQMIQHLNKCMFDADPTKKTPPNLFREACFVGGHDVAKDIAAFQEKGAHLLLGTPGRLNELLVTCRESVCFDLRNFEMLVLDEADRLLECGFKPTLTSLLKRFPKQRRTALFSATQSRELADLARAGTRNPLLVTVREQQNLAASSKSNSGGGESSEEEKRRERMRRQLLEEDGENDGADEPLPQNPDKAQVPIRLKNWYFICKYANKLEALVRYLKEHTTTTNSTNNNNTEKVLIYVMTCAGVEWLHGALQVCLNNNHGIISNSNNNSNNNNNNNNTNNNNNLFALHGQLSMDQRKKTHKAAAAASSAIIVCSDVAARGLDLPNVRHVIHFDAPTDPRTYLHRSGRTARMGTSGESLLLLSPMESDYIPFLQLQNVFLEKLPLLAKKTKNNNSHEDKQFGDTDDDSDSDDEDEDVEKDPEDYDYDDTGKIIVNKNRTLASVASDRNKLKAARGRVNVLSKKKYELKMKRRSTVTQGDLCNSPSIVAVRRSIAFHGNDALLQKAARAFVSFIRAYKEHECRHIFRLQHIDITDLTNGFGLFFVPNCGEIRLMHQLHIPLQAEFSTYTKQLDKQRKENQATRIEQQQQKIYERDKQEKMKNRNLIQTEDGAPAAIVGEDGEVVSVVDTGKKVASIHEIAQAEKQRIREANSLSQKQKKKAWAAAELAELRREAFLIKKEKRGHMSSRKVDELIGEDKVDNAMMSTRERKDLSKRRRTRSERDNKD